MHDLIEPSVVDKEDPTSSDGCRMLVMGFKGMIIERMMNQYAFIVKIYFWLLSKTICLSQEVLGKKTEKSHFFSCSFKRKF